MTDVSPPRRATMMDVAKLAHVSHQTVSRYFRFNGGLRPDTRARIDSAVEQLNYRPNLAARSMRTRKSGRLAILVPALAFNPARMLAGASGVAHEAGYVLDVISLDGRSTSRRERIIELADSGQVEGILSLVPMEPDLVATVEQNTALTVTAEFDDEMRGIGGLADASPVAVLIEHLVELGYRRFLHIAGSPGFASARQRKRAYLAVTDKLGLESVGVVDGDWSGKSGFDAIHALDAGVLPLAVIAPNDLVASGVIRAATERGWAVPGDLSVTGWDNEPMGEYLLPALTTVDVELEMLGARAMRRLINMLRDVPLTGVDNPLFQIIWRESVGPAH